MRGAFSPGPPLRLHFNFQNFLCNRYPRMSSNHPAKLKVGSQWVYIWQGFKFSWVMVIWATKQIATWNWQIYFISDGITNNPRSIYGIPAKTNHSKNTLAQPVTFFVFLASRALSDIWISLSVKLFVLLDSTELEDHSCPLCTDLHCLLGN